jgi:Ca-activated chloride channel family protein
MFRAQRAPSSAAILTVLLALSSLSLLSGAIGCKKSDGRAREQPMRNAPQARNEEPIGPVRGETYDRRADSPFHFAAREPLSTFSIDVDTASYSNVRRFLQSNQLPPRDAIRVEELINYFKYEYPNPKGTHPIAVAADVADCPWHPGRQLVRIGLQGRRLDQEGLPPRNFVFLVDTSGSMAPANRLPLLQQALHLLVDQLSGRDRVGIVAYAGMAELVLPSTPGDRKPLIRAAIDRLRASGSTNGGAGITLAYDIAQENFILGGANRVILGTDGDFNVGVTSPSDLVRLIQERRQDGIYLSVLGFGMGNLKDATMEKLAQHGNGQYAYIDSLAEARKVFVEDVATLVPIARDVKVQVQFNPARVQAYRLVGYENRLLRDQDFTDDTKDAGDMGAGHSVTALYEIVPAGGPRGGNERDIDGHEAEAADSAELLTVKVRYLLPEGKRSHLLSEAVIDRRTPFSLASSDFQFAAAVAAFGMLLRDSPYKGTVSYQDVLQWGRTGQGPDLASHREEFLRLVQTAARLAPRASRENGRGDLRD